MAGTIWDQVLSRIEAKVGRHSFHTWFKPTTLLTDNGLQVTVRVPNLLFTEWLPKHYSVVLSEALRDAGRPDADLIFVAEDVKATPPPPPPPPSPKPPGDDVAAGVVSVPAGLNPRYTLETFIVGLSNHIAHAACRAVAEAPSRSYNSMFIYGGVGLGKTHLMHAIGQYVMHHGHGSKLTYIS